MKILKNPEAFKASLDGRRREDLVEVSVCGRIKCRTTRSLEVHIRMCRYNIKSEHSVQTFVFQRHSRLYVIQSV